MYGVSRLAVLLLRILGVSNVCPPYSMVKNRISIYDFNCCSWFSYTNVNDIVIFVIIIQNNVLQK